MFLRRWCCLWAESRVCATGGADLSESRTRELLITVWVMPIRMHMKCIFHMEIFDGKRMHNIRLVLYGRVWFLFYWFVGDDGWEVPMMRKAFAGSLVDDLNLHDLKFEKHIIFHILYIAAAPLFTLCLFLSDSLLVPVSLKPPFQNIQSTLIVTQVVICQPFRACVGSVSCHV